MTNQRYLDAVPDNTSFLPQSPEARERRRKRLWPLAGATAAGLLALSPFVSKAASTVSESLRYTGVATTEVGIIDGDGGVATVCATAGELADENNINPADVWGCVEAGQEVGQELEDIHPGRAIQPGEPIVVSLGHNIWGYRVTADPASTRSSS